MTFERDEKKNTTNKEKHGVSFDQAQDAFFDDKRIIIKDLKHSRIEERFYCLGKCRDGILTVRFPMRNEKIRMIGAGFWREGLQRYE